MTKPRTATVPISLRALVQRINRKLAESDQQLKATRGDQAHEELGEFFILDRSSNAVVAKQVDPEQLGRKLGAIQAWERLAK